MWLARRAGTQHENTDLDLQPEYESMHTQRPSEVLLQLPSALLFIGNEMSPVKSAVFSN